MERVGEGRRREVRGVEERRGERRSNYWLAAEHMSAGLCWNSDEPRADSFYDSISCSDHSFIKKRGAAVRAHTDTRFAHAYSTQIE